MTGYIKTLQVGRGFGFVSPDDGSGDIFFHVKDVDHELPFDDTLLERRVTFTVKTTPKGFAAVDVRPIHEPAPRGYA